MKDVCVFSLSTRPRIIITHRFVFFLLHLNTLYTFPQSSQIARAAAIFQIDEIVVYGDESAQGRPGWGDPTLFFARVLQYMEMPQYLRKVRVYICMKSRGRQLILMVMVGKRNYLSVCPSVY